MKQLMEVWRVHRSLADQEEEHYWSCRIPFSFDQTCKAVSFCFVPGSIPAWNGRGDTFWSLWSMIYRYPRVVSCGSVEVAGHWTAPTTVGMYMYQRDKEVGDPGTPHTSGTGTGPLLDFLSLLRNPEEREREVQYFLPGTLCTSDNPPIHEFLLSRGCEVIFRSLILFPPPLPLLLSLYLLSRPISLITVVLVITGHAHC